MSQARPSLRNKVTKFFKHKKNKVTMMVGFLKKLTKFETWDDELIIIKKNCFNLT
jgi:hypothetical protein